MCREITADSPVYQDIESLKRDISDVNPDLKNFEASCLHGIYVTGDISKYDLDKLEYSRHQPKAAPAEDAARSQLNRNLATTEG